MAAITIAAATEKRARSYYINDINGPLVDILRDAVETPDALIADYTEVWNGQFSVPDHVQHFYSIRDQFNSGDHRPALLLYLIARCVKGAVRYGSNGQFNQSPDKRRHGTNPATLSKNITSISRLLKGKTTFSCLDYHDVFDDAKPGDLLYMDPPYQGVTNTRDNRYFSGVPFDEFAAALESLNERKIDYIISYDGECGGKSYGEDLPASLGCKKVLLNAGLSSQALLLGKHSTTLEALYISPGLQPAQPGLWGDL